MDTTEKSYGQNSRRPRVLIGVCGSVAAVKVPELAVSLAETCEVRLVWTTSAVHFQGSSVKYNHDMYTKYHELSERYKVMSYLDKDEWNYSTVGKDPVVHIELRKWADVYLIVPLSANTLGKLANGICDNLLTSVARAWDSKKPFIVAPAMNTYMWEHPFTSKQLDILKSINVQVVDPVSKVLACGDSGAGGLAPVSEIVEKVLNALDWHPSSPEVIPESSSTLELRDMVNGEEDAIETLLRSFFPQEMSWCSNECGKPCLRLPMQNLELHNILVAQDTATKVPVAFAGEPNDKETCVIALAKPRHESIFRKDGYSFYNLSVAVDREIVFCKQSSHNLLPVPQASQQPPPLEKIESTIF